METKICSKCNQKKPLSDYHKNGFNNNGEQKYRGYCKDCANEIEKQRYREKKTFTEQFKCCCAKCGDSRTWVLDFHHNNPDEKEFTIGKLKKSSFEIIKKEIDKCTVLCANCHREFHYLEKEQNITIEQYLNA